MPANFLEEYPDKGLPFEETREKDFYLDTRLLSLFRNPAKDSQGNFQNLDRAQIELTDYNDPDFCYVLQLDNIIHNGHRVLCRWSLISRLLDDENEEPFATFTLTELSRTEKDMMFDVPSYKRYRDYRTIFHDKHIGVIQGVINSRSAEIKLSIPDNIRAMRLDAKRNY